MIQAKQLTQIIFLLVVLIPLAACLSMPISSMLKMRNLDPLETDPGQISIAVITYKGVEFSDGDASLTIKFISDIPEHNFESEFVAALDRNPNVKVLQKEKQRDQEITLFYLDEEAANRMREVQNKIKTIRSQNIEGSGSLSINVDTGCFKEEKPDSLYASIFVKFNQEQGYILMNRGLDLFEVAEKSGADEFWVECDSSPT